MKARTSSNFSPDFDWAVFASRRQDDFARAEHRGAGNRGQAHGSSHTAAATTATQRQSLAETVFAQSAGATGGITAAGVPTADPTDAVCSYRLDGPIVPLKERLLEAEKQEDANKNNSELASGKEKEERSPGLGSVSSLNSLMTESSCEIEIEDVEVASGSEPQSPQKKQGKSWMKVDTTPKSEKKKKSPGKKAKTPSPSKKGKKKETQQLGLRKRRR